MRVSDDITLSGSQKFTLLSLVLSTPQRCDGGVSPSRFRPSAGSAPGTPVSPGQSTFLTKQFGFSPRKNACLIMLLKPAVHTPHHLGLVVCFLHCPALPLPQLFALDWGANLRRASFTMFIFITIHNTVIAIAIRYCCLGSRLASAGGPVVLGPTHTTIGTSTSC